MQTNSRSKAKRKHCNSSELILLILSRQFPTQERGRTPQRIASLRLPTFLTFKFAELEARIQQ
jgi:hypothetical protein